MSRETAHYLITGGDPLFRSAEDITDPVREIT